MRILTHIPHGVIAALSEKSLSFTAAFLVYQKSQDRYEHDRAHKDIESFLWGMAIGIIGKRIWKIVKR